MSIHLDPVLESLHTQMPISQHLNHFTNRHNTFWKVLRYNHNTPQWNTRLTSKSYQGLKFIRFKVDKNLLQPEMQMFAQKHINKYYYISEIKCLCQLLFKESVKKCQLLRLNRVFTHVTSESIRGKQTEEQRFRLIQKTYGKSGP